MIKNLKFKIKNSVIVVLIFLFALSLRLYGLNWDQGQHLHPDERFLTMVTNDIKLPSSLIQYFDNNNSPLNPYNYPTYQFFVYGTFPIFLTKLIAVISKLDDYENIVLVGRSLSAIFDSLNIFFLYFLAKKLFKNKSKLIFLPSLLYATTVLPIQLSHFYAVDTFLITFILATFTFLTYGLVLPASITFGLALACKISTIYFLPIIIIFFIFSCSLRRSLLTKAGYFLLTTFIIFRIFQPYIFDGLIKLNPLFIDNIKQLQIMSSPDNNFPPAVQWIDKIPLTRSALNLVFFGLGLPLSLLFALSLTKIILIKTPTFVYLALLWILIIYFYQGSRFAHPMRYLIVIYPFICLISSLFFLNLKSKYFYTLLFLHFLFALSFLNIYRFPHTRVIASNWIYQNIAVGSTITNEYWDDALPLSIYPNYPQSYSTVTVAPYDFDTPEKIDKLYSQINLADYIFMSSNRLWASIPLVPKLYPYTSLYYDNLFAQKLNFTKVLEVNVYPGFSLPFLNKCFYFGPSNFPGIKNNWFDIDDKCLSPGVYLRDDTAEESFTVYDHPKVLIFSRTN